MDQRHRVSAQTRVLMDAFIFDCLFRSDFKKTLLKYYLLVPITVRSDTPNDDTDNPRLYEASMLRASISQPAINADTEVANYLAAPAIYFPPKTKTEGLGGVDRGGPGEGKGAGGDAKGRSHVVEGDCPHFEHGVINLTQFLDTRLRVQVWPPLHGKGLPRCAGGTTMDMERCFSRSGDMVVRKQARLVGETVQAAQLVSNWDEEGVIDIVKYWEDKAVRK